MNPISAIYLELIVALLGALILVASYRRKTIAELSPTAVIRWGFVWIVVATGAYWLAGPYSHALLQGDLDNGVPVSWVMAGIESGTRFIHHYAGGVDASGFHGMVGQVFSLERWLFSTLPLFIAFMIHKGLLAATGLAGCYLIGREMGASRLFALVVGAICSVAYLFVTLVTILPGIGGGLVPLGVWLILFRIGRPHYWPAILAFGLTYAVSCAPLHVGLAFGLAMVVMIILTGFDRFLIGMTAFLVVMLMTAANWAEALLAWPMIAPETYRGSASVAERGGYASEVLLVFEACLVIAVSLLIALSQKRRGWLKLVVPVAAAFLLPLAAIHMPWETFRLKPLSGINFFYAYGALPTLAAAIAALAWAGSAEQRRKWLLVSMLAIMAGRAIGLNVYEASIWLNQGGQRIMADRQDLQQRQWPGKDEFRVVSVPYRLSIGLSAASGLDSYDGCVNLMLANYGEYWLHAIRKGKTLSLMSSYTFVASGLSGAEAPLEIADFADLDALRVANVGFILSRIPLKSDDLTEVSAPVTDSTWQEMGGSFSQRMMARLKQSLNPPPIRVYALKEALPRIYGAAGAVIVDPQASITEYHAQIVQAGLKRQVVFKGNADWLPPEIGPVEIVHTRLDGQGASIDIKAERAGIVVLNIPYSRFWGVTVDGRAETIHPVNGVHMAVSVPAGARSIRFDYRRPLLRDRLASSN